MNKKQRKKKIDLSSFAEAVTNTIDEELIKALRQIEAGESVNVDISPVLSLNKPRKA